MIPSRARACMVLTASLAIAVLPAVAAGADGADGIDVRGPYLEFDLGVNIMDQGEGVLEAGPRFGVLWGYRLNEWLGLEAETGLLLNSRVPPETGERDWLGQTPVLGNLVFRHESDSPWTYFGGVGAGIIVFHDDEDAGGDIAFQFKLGVRRDLNDTVSIGACYRNLVLFATSLFAEEALGDDSITACLNWAY
jgi:hypothetical protein